MIILLKPEPSPSTFVLMPLAAKARLPHNPFDLSVRAIPERGTIGSVSENERAISASPLRKGGSRFGPSAADTIGPASLYDAYNASVHFSLHQPMRTGLSGMNIPAR